MQDILVISDGESSEKLAYIKYKLEALIENYRLIFIEQKRLDLHLSSHQVDLQQFCFTKFLGLSKFSILHFIEG
ncbi:hypothetical protein T4D_2487 [Trichinella pseudospiralis]|uniref:Uncharacterized protein n=1 Tax=Trichinella pseudospiralis TaxID=6337 RepID=A0A0V1G3H9_TRIPS|nr:hypothetical protein T4D_2487 [Trichinella pseudospiralis]